MFAVHDRSVAGEGQDGKEHEDDELHSYSYVVLRTILNGGVCQLEGQGMLGFGTD